MDDKAFRRRLLEVALLLHETNKDDEKFLEFVSRIESILQQARTADERGLPLASLKIPSSLSESLESSREDLKAQGVDVEAVEAEHEARLDEMEDWYYGRLDEYSRLFKQGLGI